MTGDLAGFVASTYMRGIHFLQIPTSLTAQVDSSIGGKTGINSKMAKNMIGTFTQPDGVLIDPEVLKTLGQREFCEGLGEVIKCALIADKDLWNLLTDLSAKDLLENFAKIEEIIYRSCEVKRKVVVDDELDNGVRLYLNFGHTIGHAVENTAGYGKVMHGEAVAIGMVQISKIAEKKVSCLSELLMKSERWSKNMVCLMTINLGTRRFCLKRSLTIKSAWNNHQNSYCP